MNIVYVKIKGREEMTFPECCYEQCDKFIIVRTIGHFLAVGTFNLDVIEYVYLDYEEIKRDKRDWYGKIRNGTPEK